MDGPLERSCLHTRSDLETLGRAREGYGLWARLGCVAIRGWAPPALEKATNSKGNSEAKKKAKGRKPDAWRSRRGRTAGDPASKALRPPGDAPWPGALGGHAQATRRPRGGGNTGEPEGAPASRVAGAAQMRRWGEGSASAAPSREERRPRSPWRPPLPVAAPRSPWRPSQTCMATEAALRH